MSNEQFFQLALTLIPRVGNILIKQLISYCGSAESVFKAKYRHLYKIPGIGEKYARIILNANPFTEAETVKNNLEKTGISIQSYTEENYPHHLKKIHDAPVILYMKGNAELNNPKTVAIVGTRNATQYGKQVVEEIITGLLPHRPLIVSGLAYGIDIHAHRWAVKSKLPTVAVLASGLDNIYPSLHTPVVNEMINNDGAIISEYPPGKKAEVHFFPSRNRIIAGMVDVVVVVEAARRGGALITANLANGYHKEVFAVPGNVDHRFSKGCNHLISQLKANIYTDADALAAFMNWDLSSPKIAIKPPEFASLCDAEELALVDVLENKSKGMHIDQLSIHAQMPVNKVASILLQLEFKGLVKALPGKQFALSV